MQSLKQAARRLKKETYAVYLASTDQRVPWYARMLAGLTVAYAFSPIDLIPDFIPILGYLEDDSTTGFSRVSGKSSHRNRARKTDKSGCRCCDYCHLDWLGNISCHVADTDI
jgi:uncharacterized membrane protein YkvA (DUF1232 family)